MKTIITKHTNTTPIITFDDTNKKVEIIGNSIPFDVEMFWSLVLFQLKTLDVKTIEIKLNHINTNSVSYLLTLIKNKSYLINWVYNDFDDDMLELGQDLQNISNSKFEFICFEKEECDFVC